MCQLARSQLLTPLCCSEKKNFPFPKKLSTRRSGFYDKCSLRTKILVMDVLLPLINLVFPWTFLDNSEKSLRIFSEKYQNIFQESPEKTQPSRRFPPAFPARSFLSKQTYTCKVEGKKLTVESAGNRRVLVVLTSASRTFVEVHGLMGIAVSCASRFNK